MAKKKSQKTTTTKKNNPENLPVNPSDDLKDQVDLKQETGEITTKPIIPKAEEEPENPADQEPASVKKIPKLNTKRDELKKAPLTKQEVQPPADATKGSVDPLHNQSMNPEQAVSWAMTQSNPRAAINRLKRNRVLTDVTGTYLLLEEKG